MRKVPNPFTKKDGLTAESEPFQRFQQACFLFKSKGNRFFNLMIVCVKRRGKMSRKIKILMAQWSFVLAAALLFPAAAMAVWPADPVGNTVNTSMVVADLQNDQVEELIVGMDGSGGQPGVHIIRLDGVTQNYFATLNAVVTTPAVGDIDGDSDLDIVSVDDQGTVDIWRKDGTGWVQHTINLPGGLVANTTASPTTSEK